MDKPRMSLMRPLLLSSLLFSACGGQYDVGEQPSAESGGVGGSGGTGTGGSGESGSGGSFITGATGGASTSGGTGGADVGNGGASAAAPGSGGNPMMTGGTSTSGGVGGSSAVGGAGMMPAENFVCGVPEFDLEDVEPADEFTIRDRLTRFFFDEGADASSPALEGDLSERATELVRAWLADARDTGTVPAGLAAFMRDFMLDRIDGAEDELELGESWGGVLAGEAATLASLMTSDVNPRKTYGIFSDAAQLWPGPSARGAWIADKLFCMPIEPGPEGMMPTPEPPPGQTRREALTVGVSQPVCLGCHSIIDPLGFSMEILAPETGEVRSTDNGLPIDASGVFTSETGSNYMFTDIGMLSMLLSTSCDVARCFVTQLFDRAVAVSAIESYAQSDVDWVLYQFARDDSFTLEDALVSLVQTPAFLR